MGAIGQPLRRKEDERLHTGKGRFSDDFILEGQAYGVMVRSPHPHARIIRINAESAPSMPRVLGVFSGADCPFRHWSPPCPGGGRTFDTASTESQARIDLKQSASRSLGCQIRFGIARANCTTC
jgi:CO/xanthine dehydrogenase Mo-binding subunit